MLPPLLGKGAAVRDVFFFFLKNYWRQRIRRVSIFPRPQTCISTIHHHNSKYAYIHNREAAAAAAAASEQQQNKKTKRAKTPVELQRAWWSRIEAEIGGACVASPPLFSYHTVVPRRALKN